MCHDLQARLGRDQIFFSFPKGKPALTGVSFNNVTIIQARSLNTLAKTQTMHFKQCFEQWYDHWT
jgi:hypothetical protein